MLLLLIILFGLIGIGCAIVLLFGVFISLLPYLAVFGAIVLCVLLVVWLIGLIF